jgi:hypothetical protein
LAGEARRENKKRRAGAFAAAKDAPFGASSTLTFL